METLPVVVLALLPLAALSAQSPLPQVDRTPNSPTQEQQRLIREGVALHDQGDFDGAIARYRQVLDANPDEVYAMQELGFTYFTKKDYENALATARLGAQYQSRVLPRFHILIGNILDDMGKRDEAIAVYRAAVQESPGTALLHFNLGLSLMRSNQLAEARSELERSVSLDPGHASSHFVLGNLYWDGGYRIPAVLAFSRFLLLERASARSEKARAIVEQVVQGNVTAGDKPNHVTINLNLSPPSKKDEGDFDPVETSIGVSAAAEKIVDIKKAATPFEARAQVWRLMGDVMSRMEPGGFAARYYAPFFAELQRRGFVDAFVDIAFTGLRLDGASAWADRNGSQLRDFQDWVRTYRWPAAN
jgi:tetratricopeptide (TPR) repeat protein